MKKRLISLLVAMVLLISTAVPVTSAFAADYDKKCHPDDWFGYHHSKEEIESWITNAVGYPTVSDDAMAALKGEIRPGDVLSFQVKVDMPTGHDEIMEFLKDFSLNMTFPYGTNAMIEVYSSDAPLMTDEEYAERIADFNNSIDELEKELQDEEMLKDSETDAEAKSIYRTCKDLVDNREKYYEIFLGQLETARTKYGSVFEKSEYGSAESWYGSCEDNPNTSLEEGETYESWKENFLESSYVEPQITDEEFAEIVAEFNEQYPSLIEEYIPMLEEAENDEEVTDSDLELIKIAKESINDGTFYDTIIKYFEACRDGYYQFENDYAGRLISMFLSGWDLHNAYFGTYTFKFPDNLVQRNEHCTYIFDISIVATDDS